MAKHADLVQRGVAAFVDLIILFVVFAVLGALFAGPVVFSSMMMPGYGMVSPIAVMMAWVANIISTLVAFGYFVYFEGNGGQTIGKKAMKIKVVTEGGKAITYSEALIRNILRIIDWLPFVYIVGIILIATNDKKQRLGDIAAKTIVVVA